jgi:RNA polymerase sigma factor (TIGR02999 family)
MWCFARVPLSRTRTDEVLTAMRLRDSLSDPLLFVMTGDLTISAVLQRATCEPSSMRGLMKDAAPDVTSLLHDLNLGRPDALDRLFPIIYGELKQQAARALRGERPGHLLQPTALVHEAFLRLVNQRGVQWQNRSHFFGIAAQAMRRILIDHARSEQREKRGGALQNVTLDEQLIAVEGRSIDLLALDAALTRLEAFDERQARIVELRFFAGLSVEETAAILDISPATVKREWRVAKAWLHAEVRG